jgi:hypothetical protein
MSALLMKLDRAVANSVMAREHRQRLERELQSAIEQENARQYELKTALDQFRKATADSIPLALGVQQPHADLGKTGDSTSLAPDSTQAFLRSLNGVRD